MLAYTLSHRSPIHGLRNDVHFACVYVLELEPGQVIYSSHERIAFVKVMPKPPHQDRNIGRDRSCLYIVVVTHHYKRKHPNEIIRP